MTQTTIKDFSVRVAMMLLVMMLTTATAWATTFSTINVGGTDYTLFTGFTATDGTAVDNAFVYGNAVDGNTSTSWHPQSSDTFVEFNTDDPIIPKGYIFNTYMEGNFYPHVWVLKAKANATDGWTTLSSYSGQTLPSGQEFQYACSNDGNTAYKYFRFEASNTNDNIWLTEIRLYGNMSYTHIAVKAATCTETGIKQECWRRTDGKYFTDETGTTELAEDAVIEPMIPHDGQHHDATDTNIEYWQCSVCGKYFSDSGCTTEITEAETHSTVFGALSGGCYTLTSQTYTLTADVNTDGYIYVPTGVTATIDLAGHTIDRGLTSAVANGYVIKVAGTLTLTDSSTGGTVKGGMHDEYTSCVYVPNGGTFTLAGGSLIGNTSDEGNRAVYVAFSAHFIMTGGKITGDVCGIDASGHLTISGGEISGNTYGIWSKNYSISVSGNPVITNNTSANVQLYFDAARLTVTGALTEGASIGITPHGTPTANAPVTVTSGYGTYNTASPDTYFTLDNNSFVLGWNEDRTEIAVGTALYTVDFDMNGHGDAIDAVSLLSGYKLMKPEPTADGWYFVGWYTNAACTAGNEYDFDDAVTSNMTLHALWTQEAIYSFTLPEKMVIVSADHEAVAGKYPVGTVIKFKVSSADYVVDGDVSDGTNTLTPDGDGNYTVTMGDADITITATIKKAVEPNKTLSGSENYEAQNGDVLTGSTSGTVTIANNATITLSDVTITGGIVCAGSATITLVGTNSVTGFSRYDPNIDAYRYTAGIQVGGSGTTLTIKGNGSLTANGALHSAGIGLSRAWDVDATGGHIVIEGGNITATGNGKGAGIGTGVIYGNGSAKTARIGNITIKGGSVKATGGSEANGIGTGYTYYGCTNTIGTVTIYDGIDMVDASSISESVVYKHGENDVTANKTEYFTIIENGNRRIIVQKVTPTIADVPDQTYTGSEITPEPLVIAGSLNLTKGTDYVYSYTNNTNVGTAKVRATFQGIYASLGYVEKEFTIVWSETDTDEYTIHNAAEWNVFCDCLNDNDTYNRFSGKTVRLDADITVTRMAGSDHLDFCGTFDGQDHTLTVDISSDSRRYTAPFAYVSETTPTGGSEVSHPAIRNLNVTGTVNATKEYASGLVGAFWGTLTIENCTSSVTVNTSNKYAAGFISNAQGNAIIRNCLSSATINSTVSGDGTHAGFIGVAGSVNLNIEGCAFTGSLLGTSTTSCAGFVGYGGTVTITNSLYAPAEVTVQNDNSATFARGNTPSTTNSYYSAALGTAQGKAVRTVTAGTDVTISGIALTGSETAYTVSHITAYANGGLKRGDVLYYGSDDQLSLTLSNSATGAPQGYRYDGYTASAGTLSGTTLTMPDQDVTISVNTADLATTGLPVAVAYVDADGTAQTAQAIALDGTEEELRTDGQEKWYFVGLENVSHTGEIDCWGNVHIILCDGKTMTANHSNSNGAFWGAPNSTINIYGQTAGTGTLNINGTDCRGIDTNGDLVINGGNVNAILTINHYGFKNAIQANGSVTINGGTVTANATGGGNGIYGKNGVTINGGSVNATGGSGSGINANYGNGTITLGWNKPTDRISITASSYEGTVKVADGQAFVTDEATPAVIGGTISDLAAINGKTLKPATFYLVGNMTNPEWTVNADYQLTVNPGNTSELMIQNVPLTGSTEFKVVYSANGTESTTWYPGDGNNYWISADGIYDIYFRPDYQGGDDWHYGCIYATDVSNIEVAFAPEGFATYYHGTFDVKLPEGVKARIVTARVDDEGTLTYQTIADGDTDAKVVPAGTAVMLQTEKSTEAQQKTLTLAAHGADSPAAPTLNLLHGSDVEGTTTGDGKHYKLTYGNDNTPNADVFGWYWGAADGAAFTSPAHKAWLVLPADANARSFFGLPDDDTTGIVNAEANSSLFTLHSSLSEWYTIDGMKLSGKPTAKGVYILNGRKIVIK